MIVLTAMGGADLHFAAFKTNTLIDSGYAVHVIRNIHLFVSMGESNQFK